MNEELRITALHQQIQERLIADETLDPAVVNLVDAACIGDAALLNAVAKLDASPAASPRTEMRGVKLNPPGVYLSEVTVAGFRGIGPERTLKVAPGPGLTLLIGRNGSGKSSFAEGLETLLTNEARRWSGRAKEWKDGWKNLHTARGSFVEATFTVEGGEPLVMRRIWAIDKPLEESELRIHRGSDSVDAGALGWSETLANFRPFLSYAELGALLNKPSELYDSLKGILGLEESARAIKRLSVERKSREERQKKAKDHCKQLLLQLAALKDDDRAARCQAALKGRTWNLDEVEAVLLGNENDDNDQVVRLLRALTQISPPKIDAVAAVVAEVRSVLGKQAALAGTRAEQSSRLAEILERALQYCGDASTECPVCRGSLAATWARDAHAQLEQARQLAAAAHEATIERERCAKNLRSLFQQAPASLMRSAEVGLPMDALETWQAWLNAPNDDVAALCDHAERNVRVLNAKLEPFIELARAKLEAVESQWRPVARELAAWLDGARIVETESVALKALAAAEDWLKEADESLRDARFEPIALHSQKIWDALRQQSNVNLANIKLDGKGTKRHVELNVSVDGHDGVAVSVMSQGELNALALSLFLPRMMLAESPFRFLVIDDPVQAMDSHKVDGLARVLEEAAKTRQVIVLTHDARLLDAMRRLQIEARVLSVQRRADSVVEINEDLHPIEQHLKDAMSIAHNEQEIGAKMAARTVPAFCRLAIEAACIATIRRRQLKRGVPHLDVEQAIEDAELHPLMALAIYDDATREAEVYSYLKNKLGNRAADTFRSVKEGAHGGFQGSVTELIHECRHIANTLRNLS